MQGSACGGVTHLVDRHPSVSPERLVALRLVSLSAGVS